MSGSAKTQRTSALGQVRAIVNLRMRSVRRRTVLRRLKEEESKLFALIGGRATYEARPAPRGGSGSVTARINWRTVLEQLPKRFRAANICTVCRLKSKRFAAITRWMEAGAMKRKERGLCERVPQSRTRKPRKPA